MLEPGTILSHRYTLIKALGRGGMGSVYLASVAALGDKKVAIKEMEPQVRPQDMAAALKQFQTEATFLANLDHPNLVPLSDFFSEGDRHYLVMAYVDGETLEQKLEARGAGFDWPEVKAWAITLCEVLHYLHSQTPPILFRDLKPSNIMVDTFGTLKLIDFGIARLGDSESRTATFLKGTASSGYSPIEQHGDSGSTDARSDVYSLGATVYCLLTGSPPPASMKRLYGHPIKAPSRLRPELPASIDEIVLRAISPLAKDRYQSVDEMRQALLDCCVDQPELKPEPAEKDPEPVSAVSEIRPSRPDRARWGLLAFALLLTLAAAIFFATGSP